MKNRISQTIGLVVALLLTVCFNTFSQTDTSLKVGNVNGSTGSISDASAANRVLSANFQAPAYVSNIAIEYSASEQKYYLTGKVNNNVVSGIAIQLHQEGNELFARIGPGVEITCVGYNCSDCRVSFKSKRPNCVCFTATSSDMRCDMISKITIGF